MSLHKIDESGSNLNFGSRRKASIALLIAINLVLVAGFAFSFRWFVKNINSEQEENNIVGIENSIGTLADGFGSYLSVQHMVANGYANYITRADMNMQDAVEYLLVWENFYEAIAIISPEKKTGLVLSGRSDDTTVYYDFHGHGWAEELVDEYINGTGNSLHISSVFKDAVKDLYDIGFYEKAVIDGKEQLIVFIYNTDMLVSGGMNVQGLDIQNGVLLDSQGRIITGEVSGITNPVGISFFEYFDSRNGKLSSEILKKDIAEKGEFVHTVTDSTTGVNYAAIAKTVPLTDGWIYVYFASEEEYGVGNMSFKFTLYISAFVAIWTFVNIIFFFMYNRIIKLSFKIIEKQNEELEDASKAKSAFVSNVSHELRTPINAVLGMNEMILKESTEENVREYAYDVQSAGHTLLSVINEVLDFSKIESGRMEIVEAEYEFANLMKETDTIIRPRAERKKLDFIITVSPIVPKKMIGDDVRIRQVLINLLTNAVKYTEEGKVALIVDYENDGDEAKLMFSVTDTGIGLKPEEMDKLFEEYTRLDMKKNRKTEGTGLGLPLVRKTLKLMNSELGVESVYGVGSRFFFDIKQKIVDKMPVGTLSLNVRTVDKEVEKTQIANSAKVKESHARMLVVDDTPLNLKVIQALLKDTNLKVDLCESGEACLKMCKETKYDMIFLDHRMPGMDGIDTIHALQGNEGLNRETPVIALTANVVAGAREMYLSEGFYDFVSKPVTLASLNKCIEDCLKL